METRRTFLKKSAAAAVAVSLPSVAADRAFASYPPLNIRDPKSILILFYSQTGMTQRYARLIGCILKDRGLAVTLGDLQEFNGKAVAGYDLIFVGTPVFYYDTPVNVVQWLEALPSIEGKPVAAFVSFGGPEGNQHNASSHILKLLARKGGVPVGRAAFRNIATYPTPRWDSPKQLSGSHLPNKETYKAVRRFAAATLDRVKKDEPIGVHYEVSLREIFQMLPLASLNKKAITKHAIDADKCIRCGTCVKKCPVKATDPVNHTIDREKCLACFGCLNNCPAGAIIMEYRGQRLYGFPEYLKRNKITIQEPSEFATCQGI